MDEYLSAFGIEAFSHDYTKDVEFCRKHPCDFMKPHRFANGVLTYRCMNQNLWSRTGLEKEILQNLNEGCFEALEACARCFGVPCAGERKRNEDSHHK